MENWQFFLQKEGDYAWLPLETPQVEILEGRYQLIAHTPDAGSSVRVSIRHLYERENVPQENIQESVRQVEGSGKLEILPLVYLGLGAWSISCQPLANEQNDSTPPPSYALDIDVLSQDFDLFEDWNFEPDHQAQDASMIPVEIELSDLVEKRDDPPQSSPVTVAIEQAAPEFQPEPTKVESILTSSILPSESDTLIQDETGASQSPKLRSDNIILPNWSTDVPSVEFRTVSSKELPRLVSDEMSLESTVSPQLPSFTRSKASVCETQDKRFESLSKIQFIASVVGQHEPQRELSRASCQEKFQSKLTQMAGQVGI